MDPVFCIIMRTDLDSLNPGKAMAQSAHAQAALSHHMKMFRANSKWDRLYAEWKGQSRQGFGETLVYGGFERDFQYAMEATEHAEIVVGIVLDDTYPLRDGTFTHRIPIDTCVYIFGEREDTEKAINSLGLHP